MKRVTGLRQGMAYVRGRPASGDGWQRNHGGGGGHRAGKISSSVSTYQFLSIETFNCLIHLFEIGIVHVPLSSSPLVLSGSHSPVARPGLGPT